MMYWLFVYAVISGIYLYLMREHIDYVISHIKKTSRPAMQKVIECIRPGLKVIVAVFWPIHLRQHFIDTHHDIMKRRRQETYDRKAQDLMKKFYEPPK